MRFNYTVIRSGCRVGINVSVGRFTGVPIGPLLVACKGFTSCEKIGENLENFKDFGELADEFRKAFVDGIEGYLGPIRDVLPQSIWEKAFGCLNNSGGNISDCDQCPN